MNTLKKVLEEKSQFSSRQEEIDFHIKQNLEIIKKYLGKTILVNNCTEGFVQAIKLVMLSDNDKCVQICNDIVKCEHKIWCYVEMFHRYYTVVDTISV